MFTAPNPQPWTELSETERRFSGTGIYRHEFVLDASVGTRTLLLELDDVCDIARVVVNGQDCGVAWTAPFRLGISAAVRPGSNVLEVHVATPWRNRLIAEAANPNGEIFAPMTAVYQPTATVQPAGLAGSVSLLVSC